MPSLNLKTKKLRYAKADETALEAAQTLLITMAEWDEAVKKSAGECEAVLSSILAHVRSEREREASGWKTVTTKGT